MSKNVNSKMSTKEKMWIVLLIAVIAIAIALIVGLGSNRVTDESIVGEQGQAQTQGQTQGDNDAATEETETYASKLEDGTRMNTSNEFNTTKKYKDLEISNIQFTEKNGMSVLLADVKNTGSSKHEEEVVKITIVGEDGKETQVRAIIEEIEAGETAQLNTSMTADMVNAKDFKVEGA